MKQMNEKVLLGENPFLGGLLPTFFGPLVEF